MGVSEPTGSRGQELGLQDPATHPHGKLLPLFPAMGIWSKGLTWRARGTQSLHIPENGLALDWLLGNNSRVLGISSLIKVSLGPWAMPGHLCWQCNLWWMPVLVHRRPWTIYSFDFCGGWRMSSEALCAYKTDSQYKSWTPRLKWASLAVSIHTCCHISLLRE